MKTPEEIKKGLECCAERTFGATCKKCAYDCVSAKCIADLQNDALAYIQQLEAQMPRWISAKKPPKEEGEYIVIVRRADDREERMWDIFRPGHGWCEENEGECVIAWMSFDALPDLPEEWKP